MFWQYMYSNRGVFKIKLTKYEVILIRFTEKSLSEWLSSYRRKPIVLRGGSTLVRMFAQSAKLDLI
jgi:hypothetical protein